MDNFTANVTFMPETLAKYPALRGWRASFPAVFGPAFLAQVQKGDVLQMQGVPVPTGLTVVGRIWEVMADEATLTIVLKPQES